ncbi:MAG: protein-L-isoaspartate(D-aspartate) O-methyltransferase [Candidatus Fermentibacterota bacterium]
MPGFERSRASMVRGLRESFPGAGPSVLAAMEEVPRHLFVERGLWHRAYTAHSLPIGCGQTLSQPMTVLRCLSALELRPGFSFLEIGSGSGYLAAVASRVCSRVTGIERQLSLVAASRRVLDGLGYHNVTILYGDGTDSSPRGAPFDAVLVSAGAPEVPSGLAAHLSEGGLMAVPVGDRERQRLRVLRKRASGLQETGEPFDCSFVPLVGRQGWNG